MKWANASTTRCIASVWVMADILVIAGLSGAGRSQAADDLEDLGWFVVDNLPVSLIDKVVELSETASAPQNRLALVVGVASHHDHSHSRHDCTRSIRAVCTVGDEADRAPMVTS